MLKQTKLTNEITGWQSIINWLNPYHAGTSKLQLDIARFAFSTAVYYVWRERNSRLYQQSGKYHTVVIREILKSISYATCSWRGYKLAKSNWELAIDLGISMEVFSKP